jgi:hypothetical protein
MMPGSSTAAIKPLAIAEAIAIPLPAQYQGPKEFEDFRDFRDFMDPVRSSSTRSGTRLSGQGP